MRHLHIDIETYCSLDVSEVGLYRYSEDSTFEIMLFAYSWDGGPVIVVDCTRDEFPGENIPGDVWEALTDPSVVKVAHNAAFEFECLRRCYGLQLEYSQWECTMIAGAYLGLPLGLDKVGQVLNLASQKDTKGKALITFFCKPCRATKANGGRVRNMSSDDPQRWAAFMEYNAQDVRTEVEVFAYVSRFPAMLVDEREYFLLDQLINSKGITVDLEFIEAAIAANAEFVEVVHSELMNITRVDNPNSLTQLKRWIETQTGEKVPTLGKTFLEDAIAGGNLPARVLRVLKLRQLGSKTSISKYDAMLAYACADGRIRGLLQYYGANRTGRFAGRGVQVQNLKRTLKAGLEVAREAVRKGVVGLLYDDVADVISKLTRTALVAAEGQTLVISDFAAIEARVLAWEAGEQWVLEVFNSHGKIYEATAANMFHVPLEMVTKGSDLRSKGKVATLALGYQGGSGALVQMGALREGLQESELPALVSAWRSANPRIVKLWREVEGAAKHVVKNKTSYILHKPFCSLTFSYDRGYLFIELPSGRRLAYFGAEVTNGRLTYWGVDQTKKIWAKTDTYGGSLVENITQAIARDCLCDAMLRMHRAGIAILMHIHDEIVAEAPEAEAQGALDLMNSLMAEGPKWAMGLPLKGDGFISKFYKKD